MREPAGQPSLDNDIGFLLKQFTLRRIEGFMNLVGQETHLLNGHSTCGTEITKTLTGVDPLPAGKQGNHGIGKRAFAGGNLARYGYGSNRQLSAPLSTGEGRIDLRVLYPINPNIANPTCAPARTLRNGRPFDYHIPMNNTPQHRIAIVTGASRRQGI